MGGGEGAEQRYPASAACAKALGAQRACLSEAAGTSKAKPGEQGAGWPSQGSRAGVALAFVGGGLEGRWGVRGCCGTRDDIGSLDQGG